jgi:hypothetical protein
MKIKGMGTWMHRNHRKEYFLVLARAYPKGRFNRIVKADSAIIAKRLC